ncbi:MAG: hypothetical protein ACTSXG_03430 [Alphaproteobacteria bacterium]
METIEDLKVMIEKQNKIINELNLSLKEAMILLGRAAKVSHSPSIRYSHEKLKLKYSKGYPKNPLREGINKGRF